MSPPAVLHPIVLKWACRQRGVCCRKLTIHIRPERVLPMVGKLEQAGRMREALRLRTAHKPDRREGEACVMPTDGGACMFLRDNLCGYRIDFGHETLPVSCGKFPYLGMITPERRLVGLSFACPTALDLLAAGGDAPVLDGHDGELPLSEMWDLRGDAPDDPASPAWQFWETHWSWYEVFRELTGTPAERVDALARRATGAEVPVVAVDERLWSGSELDLRFAEPLLAMGADEDVLAAVYARNFGRIEPDDIANDPSGDDLLNRYLDHRLMVPEFLSSRASLVRLLGAMFAAVARYRIERAWGKRVMYAVLHIDRLIQHSDYVSGLFPDDLPEMEACRSLWLLARAAGARS